MIRHDLLHVIKRDRQHESFIYPYYGSYSIAEVGASIQTILGATPTRAQLPFTDELGTFDRLLFFFVDGFGFDHFVDYEHRLPFFDTLAVEGTVYPLTSVFPSTTPAALTTYHTGITPQEHGLLEWTMYFEEFGEVIEPLPFRTHLTGDRDMLVSKGGVGTMLFEGLTLYEKLQQEGITSYVFIASEYADSTYSLATQRGATIIPHSSPGELFQNLTNLLNTDTGRSYFFVNWSDVDSTEHAFGPKSQEHLEALQRLSSHLTDSLVSRIAPERAANTLFLLSSDHGQSSIFNEDIIYLNDYLDLEKSYRISRFEKSIPPTGSPHDVFLHVREEAVPKMLTYLCEKLQGKAEVITTEEAAQRGLFGLNSMSKVFKERMGTIVILPYEGYHIWYQYSNGGIFSQKGIHGGLSQEEMIVPLAAIPLSTLVARHSVR